MITLCDIQKNVTIVGSGSNCVRFYGNRTNKYFRHYAVTFTEASAHNSDHSCFQNYNSCQVQNAVLA